MSIFLCSPAFALTEKAVGFVIEPYDASTSYYMNFTRYMLDEDNNIVSQHLGILLVKSDGSTTNEISEVITSYKSDNYTISTTFSSSADLSFTVGSDTYYIRAKDGSTLVPTNNRYVLGDSVYIDNYYNGSSNTSYGGAVSITGTVSSINADFISNQVLTSGIAAGGAISNTGTISSITGDFINNWASNNTNSNTATTNTLGGAIYNANTIGTIKGDFIGNVASRVNLSSGLANNRGAGGAIYNGYDISSNYTATITSIEGDFIGNTASFGGAIMNGSTEKTNTKKAYIYNITGNFIGNIASGNSGGAIANYYNAYIGTITGDFIENTASTGGGAISNSSYSTIDLIDGSFISNYSSTHGGAIHNTFSATINSIIGDFGTNKSASDGGAIYNVTGTIGSITGNFVDNEATFDGGAIYNSAGTINTINGSFVNNSSADYGGAIYNYTYGSYSSSAIKAIFGDFIYNSAKYGGAIYNGLSNIGTIGGDFFYNTADVGGAIYNAYYNVATETGTTFGDGSIVGIEGFFVGNRATGTDSTTGSGGAIANIGGHTSKEQEVEIGYIYGSFIDNTAAQSGGAILNHYGTVGIVDGDFTSNSAVNNGGAISNTGDGALIKQLISNFIANSAANGGALYNGNNAVINNVSGAFNYNTAANGGAIYNDNATIKNLSSSFIGNSATTNGGAIFNTSTGNIYFVANNANYAFTNNYIDTTLGKNYNAIYNEGNIYFNLYGNSSYTINDSITGTGTAYIIGQNAENNILYLNDTTSNSLDISKATLRLSSFYHDNNTYTNAFGMTSGNFNFDSSSIFRINLMDFSGDEVLNGFTITGDTGSKLIVENVTKGTYYYGIDNTRLWQGSFEAGNSLQEMELFDTYFTIKIVQNSVLYDGPMGDIIKEAANKEEFGQLSGSLLGGYLADTTDFIYGGTNSIVGSASQQAAFIEGTAKISSVIGVNANTLHTNRDNYETISTRELENSVRFREDADRRKYEEKNKESMVIYDANGRIKEEYRDEYNIDKNFFMRFIEDNNLSLWVSPSYRAEKVDGLASDGFATSYNSKIYNLVAGFDTTIAEPNSRTGLAFASGMGKTDTFGDYNDIRNDFSYTSIVAYESFNVSKWLLNANLGFTSVTNEIVQDLTKFEMQDIFSNVDSYIANFALKAEYTTSIKDYHLSPYLGLELVHLTSRDYTVNMGDSKAHNDVIYYVDTHSQELVLIPLGVKFEKEFSTKHEKTWLDNWAISPEIDFGALLAFGEKGESFYVTAPDFDSDATLTGEVLDFVSCELGLSVLARKENIGFNLNYNLDFSKNRIANSIALNGIVSF